MFRCVLACKYEYVRKRAQRSLINAGGTQNLLLWESESLTEIHEDGCVNEGKLNRLKFGPGRLMGCGGARGVSASEPRNPQTRDAEREWWDGKTLLPDPSHSLRFGLMQSLTTLSPRHARTDKFGRTGQVQEQKGQTRAMT